MSVYLLYKSIQCFGYAVRAGRYNVLLLYKYCSLSICSDGDSEASVPGYMPRPLIYFDSNAIIHPPNESWSAAMHWQHAIAPNRNVEDGLRNRTYLDTVILCMHLRRQVSGLFIWFISWINSFRPSDAIWSQRSGSTLAQVMVCCLMAPSHDLNQCWLIIRKVQWHPSESNLARIPQPSITEISSLKITNLECCSNLTGANELTIRLQYVCPRFGSLAWKYSGFVVLTW